MVYILPFRVIYFFLSQNIRAVQYLLFSDFANSIFRTKNPPEFEQEGFCLFAFIFLVLWYLFLVIQKGDCFS